MENSTANPTASPPRAERSEQAFLADQAAAAQSALSGTIERMRADLGASGDLSAWARKYPWPTVGAAAAVGFLATVVIGRPPARRRAEPASSTSDAGSPREAAGNPAQDRGLIYSLLSELMRSLATAAQGAIMAAIAARFAPPADPMAAESTTDGSSGDAPSGSPPSDGAPSGSAPSGNGAAPAA